MVYGFLGIGFALLLIGSEAVLRGGASLFREVGVPPVITSLLIVAAAMSVPELAVVAHASRHAMPDIVLGVVVGGVIANSLLVFGLGAILHPLPTPPRVVFRDSGALILASIVFVCIALAGFIGRPLGVLLIVGLAGYLILVTLTDWRRPIHDDASERDYGLALSVFLIAIGIVCLFFGARLAIDFAILLARDFHLSQAAVALTVVALGTTLPELFATLISARRGHPNALSGHIVASSLFNLLLVLGIAALMRPLSVAPMLAQFDAPVMLAIAIVLPMLMLFGWRLTRVQGVLLLLAYFAYVASVGIRSGLYP